MLIFHRQNNPQKGEPMKFLAAHRTMIFTMFLVSAFLTSILCVTGCAAAAFLTDLESVIPIALTGITGILSILAGIDPELSPAVAIVTPIIQKVEADLTTVKQLQAEYKSNASESVLEQIEAAVNEIIGNLNTVLQTNGLPTDEAAKISAIATAVNAELQAVLSTLPVFQASTAGQTLSVTKPSAAADFQAKINAVVAPTA
jgi:hypothetical protein